MHQETTTMIELFDFMRVNHGPGPVTLTQTVGRMFRARPWKKPSGAILKTYGSWPFDKESHHVGGFGLPLKLEVGESVAQFLRPNDDHYKEVKKSGFSDSFGRIHWASSRSVKQARSSWLKREDK